MIRVRKNHKKPPGILTSKGCLKKIEQALLERGDHKLSSTYCGNEVRLALKEIYKNKCAYCETDTSAGTVLRIEHYRPRNGIKGEKHSGYYWLIYEWSNLLAACENCNRAKSNAFPIDRDGKRATGPVYIKGKLSKGDCLASSKTLRAEKPLILHPEIDEPEKNIIFLPDGMAKGITRQGRQTIDLCKLNRGALVLARKKVIDSFLADIEEILGDLIDHQSEKEFSRQFNRLLIKLLKAHEPQEPYSRLRWFMFLKFDLFFIKQLGKKQQAKVRIAYKSFRKRYYDSTKC